MGGPRASPIAMFGRGATGMCAVATAERGTVPVAVGGRGDGGMSAVTAAGRCPAGMRAGVLATRAGRGAGGVETAAGLCTVVTGGMRWRCPAEGATAAGVCVVVAGGIRVGATTGMGAGAVEAAVELSAGGTRTGADGRGVWMGGTCASPTATVGRCAGPLWRWSLAAPSNGPRSTLARRMGRSCSIRICRWGGRGTGSRSAKSPSSRTATRARVGST